MKFEPLYDRVAILPIEQECKTAGGIIVPETAKEKPMKGEVAAVGKGSKDEKGNFIPLDVKVGDIVIYGKWSGTEVKVEDQTYLVIKESDILGRVKK